MNAVSDPIALTPPALDEVLEFIRADAASGRLAAWGISTLIDEHTGVPTIEQELADVLHRVAGLPEQFPLGNAGVLHVYGYWFSDVVTPFGFKRDRWADGQLAAIFGLEPEAFHLTGAGETTPLERITEAALPVLQSPPAGALVAEAYLGDRLARVVFYRCVGQGLLSVGSADDGTGVAGVPESTDASAPQALIYGVADAPGGQLKLVTTFTFSGNPEPVLKEFEAHPLPRWNAVVMS